MTSQGRSSLHSNNKRIAWIDNLRAVIIIFVVHFHSCITYSHVGDWYIKDGPEGTLTEKLPYIFWIFHLQSFFMGVLFFIGGWMAYGALQRKGSWNFIVERTNRLAVPALLYMFIVHPFILYKLMNGTTGSARFTDLTIYLNYIKSGDVWSGSGPLWFVLTLLVFCISFTLCSVYPNTLKINTQPSLPSTHNFFILALFLSLATAITRIFFPIGTSVFNFQFAYFPQYIVFFILGIALAQNGGLDKITDCRWARKIGLGALIGGPLFLALILFIGGGPTEGPQPGEHGPILYFGGLNLYAFLAATWEQTTGMGLALGILVCFRRQFDVSNAVTRWVSSRSFAVYFIHAPVLVWLTTMYDSLAIDTFPKILLLTLSGLIISFGFAEIIKRTWGIGRYF